jgi:hypothetical protein
MQTVKCCQDKPNARSFYARTEVDEKPDWSKIANGGSAYVTIATGTCNRARFVILERMRTAYRVAEKLGVCGGG